MERICIQARRLLPDDTKYEAAWWNRKLILDGPFNGPAFLKQESYDSALVYANKISIGNLKTLRQFLEVSMRKTQQFWYYIERFREMLNRVGRGVYDRKLKQFGFERYSRASNRLINLTLGFTRKRGLLVPEWADDTKLWVPNGI